MSLVEKAHLDDGLEQMMAEGKVGRCEETSQQDFWDDPFSFALDKVLGLTDSDVEGCDEDLVFDDLSFSEGPLGRHQVKDDEKSNSGDSETSETSFMAHDETSLEAHDVSEEMPQEEQVALGAREEVAVPRPCLGIEGEQLPVDKPKRSLSAYNFFFKAERKRLLETLPVRDGPKPRRSHGKMGFAEMARIISIKWKNITPAEKIEYDHLSALDGERYESEKEAWKKWETTTKGNHSLDRPSAPCSKQAGAVSKKSPSLLKNMPPASSCGPKVPVSESVPLEAKSSNEPVCNGRSSVAHGEENVSKKRKIAKDGTEKSCSQPERPVKRSKVSKTKPLSEVLTKARAKASKIAIDKCGLTTKRGIPKARLAKSGMVSKSDRALSKEDAHPTVEKEPSKHCTDVQSKNAENNSEVRGEREITKRKKTVQLNEKPGNVEKLDCTDPCQVEQPETPISKKTVGKKSNIATEVLDEGLESSEEDSDNEDDIDTVLGKLDFDLLTFAEMLQDTSFSSHNLRVVEDSDDETDSTHDDQDKKPSAKAVPLNEAARMKPCKTDLAAKRPVKGAEKPNQEAKKDPEKKTEGILPVERQAASTDVVKPHETDSTHDDQDKKPSAKAVPLNEDAHLKPTKTNKAAKRYVKRTEKPNQEAKKDKKKKAAGILSVEREAASTDEDKPRPVISMKQLKKITGKDSKKKIVRCLSAYNIFFKAERQKLLDTLPARDGKQPRRSHGKMGFADMARTIASKWKSISAEEKMHYEHLSALDCDRYEQEKKELAATEAASPVSDDDTIAATDGKGKKGDESLDVIDLSSDDPETEHDSTPATPAPGSSPVSLMMSQQPYMTPPPFFYAPHHMASMMATAHMVYPRFVSPMSYPDYYSPLPPHQAMDILAPPPPISDFGLDVVPGDAVVSGGGGSMITCFLRKSLCKR